MTTSAALLDPSIPADRTTSGAISLARYGAAFCFIGHGAFGFITKAAWLPYFAVVGIPEVWAWRLMPIVGAVDVLAGMAVLFAPRRLPLLYMTFWAAWTALLRPLSGEPFFEAIERAGNYGVPLAFLVLAGWPRPARWRHLVEPLADLKPDGATLDRTRSVLKWSTVLLLAGHGALGAFSAKATLTHHYALLGLPATTTVAVGWVEIAVAVLVGVRPSVPVLVLIAVWKMTTEMLYPISGTPIWEFVERAGSYAAPLALALLLMQRRRPPDPSR